MKELENIVCKIENPKGSPATLEYGLYFDHPVRKDVSIKIFYEGEQTGNCSVLFFPDHMKRDQYYPICRPDDLNASNRFANKGISHALMYFLSKLAIVNSIKQVKSRSLWLHNMHVNQQYFADQVKTEYVDWTNLSKLDESIGLFSRELVDWVVVKDQKGQLEIALLRLEKTGKDTYKVQEIGEPQNAFTDNSKINNDFVQGDEVHIDSKGNISDEGKTLGKIVRSRWTVIDVKGAPRFPAERDKDLAVEEFNGFKYLVTRTAMNS